MVAGRDPIDRIVDIVIAVPLCSAIAARRSLSLVARVARDQLSEQMARSTPSPDAVAGPREQVSASAPPDASTEVPAAATPSDLDDELPIEGYDQLAARQVVDRLATLDDDDLDIVEQYELEHRHRSTVLGRIAQLRS
ncbi:MAG: hypothetical protein QNJ12_21945 [Ilumatobacter sp.]|uniref:hypothetical protein n=1 Tax=Ilumatobacter sp. TaxID=1967498 RepID=UPI0026229917|nr:hypothetical protein [Ilumatobacter sp.]MDJ0771464.1 hypothetical protein [Ilumatobacter sp.]